jgi:lipopolysaccharide export system protein LptA
MHRASAVALVLALAVLAAPRAAQAQGTCTLRQQTGPFASSGPEGQRIVEASGPLLVVCDAGEELRADSAVIFQAMNEVHLYGRVDYKDPTRTLTSDYATYNSGTGRLWATGNVVFTDRTRGSTLRGPNLEYFRAVEGRPEPQAIATGRPHLTVVPRSDGPRRRDPMEVDADRITTMGERYVTAQGQVIIRGKEMNGAAEEAFYDADAERMELRRNARATGDRYELTGQYIESTLRDGALSHVLARENARLVNDRLRITGPQLQLWFEDDLLQRMVSGHATTGAAAAGRSVALASGFRMEADSLEAISPGQRMREVHAIGSARGESWDTTRVSGPALDSDDDGSERLQQLALEERDLIFADTIIGYFKQDTAGAVAADTAAAAIEADAPQVPAAAAPADPGDDDPELERMVATGDARSLYRTRSDREGEKAGINYVTGDQIDLAFLDGEVDVARVRGLKRGLYLDPIPATAARPAPTDGAEPAPADDAEPLPDDALPDDVPPPPAPEATR